MLAVLRLAGNAYGASIAEELEKWTGRRHSSGAIYTTLERLETKGYVGSREGEPSPERGGRAKLLFRLTGSGQKILDESLSDVHALTRGGKTPAYRRRQ
jgi:DNA-binding PadR family transcriptional regulator